MTDDVPMATEKRCPGCGTESVAWVTTNPPTTDGARTGETRPSDQFECRKCGLLFNYQNVE
jgi:hypothetical protein